MNRLTHRILLTVLVVSVASLGAATGSRGTGPLFDVTDLGQVQAFGMNDAGHVIYFSGITGHSFLWVNGTATDMGAFVALAINGSDVVVGTQGNNPVEWTSGGGLVTLPLLAGYDTGRPTAINASGVVTGSNSQSWNAGFFHAVVWTSPLATPTDLDGSITDTCQTSQAHGINATGQIAAEGSHTTVSNCSLGRYAAAYVLGTGATQVSPDGARGVGLAINDAGVVVGYSFDSHSDSRAFRYDGTLHDLGLGNSQATAINNSGDIVGIGGTPLTFGFLYQNGIVTNLNQLTFINLIPTAINSSGEILARSTVTQHSYLLTPVSTNADLAASLSHSPEPSTIDSGTDKAHVVWTARLTNNGPAEASGAQLSVALPSGFSLSGGGLDARCTGTGPFTCAPSGGTLASGAHVDFTIAADASAPLSADATATASATSPDPTSANDSATDATTVQAPVPTFSPASGRHGASVTITGAAFTGATAVDFHGTHSSFVVASDNEIDATVPPGATSGTIAVATPAGTWVSAQSFTVVPDAPTITGLSPSRARVGASVTVTGTNLGPATSVQVSGTSAQFSVASETELTFTVPLGAGRGHVSVTTPGGTASSPGVFVLLPSPPIVQGLSPLQGHVGVTVTISGQSLSGATGVTFNGTPAAYSVVSDSRITAQVPAGATTGRISVTASGRTGWSWTAFTVLPATVPVPAISDFTPASGRHGIRVFIHGSGFLGATTVSFNGVSASFRVVKDSTIYAWVPLSATTGHIAVTTPGGTATSSQVFAI